MTDAYLVIESSDYSFKINLEEIKFNIEKVSVWKDSKEMEIRLTNKYTGREDHSLTGTIMIDGKDFDKIVKVLK